MLEPPALDPHALLTAVSEAYHHIFTGASFLPLGADPDTAVYRATAEQGEAFLLKLRRGSIPEPTVSVPFHLAETGVRQIIAPLRTSGGRLWAAFGEYTITLYPFVVGQNAWDVALSPDQWQTLGATMRHLHTLPVPPGLLPALPHEELDDRWRSQVLAALEHPPAPADEPAHAFAALLHDRRDTIVYLVARSRALAERLRISPRPICLTHGDLHAGNLLLQPDGTLFVVDWDTLALAPKERDLMFIGGGIGGIWNRPEEADWFYAGYGPTSIDREALAYYRYERIVQDIAIYCTQLLNTADGGEDRPLLWRQIRSQFAPGDVVDIALRTAA